jgi:hypothetical protein
MPRAYPGPPIPSGQDLTTFHVKHLPRSTQNQTCGPTGRPATGRGHSRQSPSASSEIRHGGMLTPKEPSAGAVVGITVRARTSWDQVTERAVVGPGCPPQCGSRTPSHSTVVLVHTSYPSLQPGPPGARLYRNRRQRSADPAPDSKEPWTPRLRRLGQKQQMRRYIRRTALKPSGGGVTPCSARGEIEQAIAE